MLVLLESLRGNPTQGPSRISDGSGSGAGDAAAGAPDEPVLVAVGAGAEPAAALEAVPLVAAVAGAAEHVALAAAAGAGGGEGGGGGHDAAVLAGLVEAPDLLGAAEVAAQSMSAPPWFTSTLRHCLPEPSSSASSSTAAGRSVRKASPDPDEKHLLISGAPAAPLPNTKLAPREAPQEPTDGEPSCWAKADAAARRERSIPERRIAAAAG